MTKLIQIQCFAYFILISLSWAQKAQSGAPQIGRGDTIKLICSGTITDVIAAMSDVPVSGVYVVIEGDVVSIFNVPSFPDYKIGMMFDVQSKNPSKFWMQNRKTETIFSTINRINGDIHVEEISPSRDRMLRWFNGKCTNSKPVF